jgi:hypothetical protein
LLLGVLGALGIAQLLFGGVVLFRAGAPGLFGGDFIAYDAAGQAVLSRGWASLYDVATQEQIQAALRVGSGLPSARLRVIPFNYPPPAALIFVAFALLQAKLAVLIWVVLNVVLAALSAVCFTADEVVGRALQAKLRIVVVLLTFCVVPLEMGLLLGQPVGVLLLLSTLGFLSLKRQPWKSGVWFGLLAAFKPQLVVAPALALLLMRRWSAVACLALVGAMLSALTLVLVGASGIASYLQLLRLMDSFRGNPALAVTLDAMVNWRVFIARIPSLDDSSGFFVTTCVDVATLALAALCWWRPLGADDTRRALGFLGLSAAGILGSYHSHYQDLVVLVAPGMIVALCALVPQRDQRSSVSKLGWSTIAAGLLLAVLPSIGWAFTGIFMWSFAPLNWSMAILGLALLILPVRSTAPPAPPLPSAPS